MRWRILTGVLLLPFSAHAGGITVGEAGSEAMERAGAFVAKADDPTALSANPAGLMATKHVAIYLGSNVLYHSLSFQRSGVYAATQQATQPSWVGQPYPEMVDQAHFQPVPMVAAAYRWQRLAFSAGVFAMQAAPNRDFQCTTPDDCPVGPMGAPAPQRYDTIKETAIIAMPSIGVAYRVLDNLDVGVRASWGFGTLQARTFVWALPNTEEDPGKDGDFTIDVQDNFIPSFGLGVLYRPTSYLELGAEYWGPQTFDASGVGQAKLGAQVGPPLPHDYIEPIPDPYTACGTGGTVEELKTCMILKLPMKATLGARYIFRDALGAEQGDVELDLRWENWSAASDISIVVDGRSHDLSRYLETTILRHGFNDTFSVRLGGSYHVTSALELRGGLSYDTAAAPDSWTRVDIDGMAKQIVSVGAAYTLGWARIDAGFAYVNEPSVTTTNVDLGGNPPMGSRQQPDPGQPLFPPDDQKYGPFNAGTYNQSYVIGMIGVTANY